MRKLIGIETTVFWFDSRFADLARVTDHQLSNVLTVIGLLTILVII